MKALGSSASIVALGEVMLRFDPGAGRVNTARRFDVWEGGGEYNVARSMRRAFGQRASVVTALVDNPIGALVEDLILQGASRLSSFIGGRTMALGANAATDSTSPIAVLERARAAVATIEGTPP